MKKEPKLQIADYYISRLLEPVMRKRVEAILQNLREQDLNHIWWGREGYGPTFKVLSEVLEAL